MINSFNIVSYHSTFFFLDQFNRVKYHAQSSFFGASLSLDRISFTCLARAYLFPSLPRDELRNTSVYCHLFFFCTPTHAGGWGKGAEEENDLRSGEGGREEWLDFSITRSRFMDKGGWNTAHNVKSLRVYAYSEPHDGGCLFRRAEISMCHVRTCI